METEVRSYSNSAILVVIYCFQLKYYHIFTSLKYLIIYINTYLIYFYEIIMMTKYPEELFKQETVYFKTLF